MASSQIAALREWLKEDETRLGPGDGRAAAPRGMSENDFNQWADKWPNGPSETWHQFNNWANG